MAQRFLVMGDNHGDAESLRRVLADTEGETFDFAVHVGDLTDARRQGRDAAADHLRTVEPLLEAVAARTRNGLVWVYGDRDQYGDVPYDLDVGVRLPDEGHVTVGGQRFTRSPAAVESDVVLVTHMEHWSRIDHFGGRAHFCGHSHHGRYLGRRLNAAFLQFTDRDSGEPVYGGYFVVDVGDAPPFEVEMRPVGGLERVECDRHGERGVQFLPYRDCMYCRDQRVLMREMAASAFFGRTAASRRDAATADELVEYAAGLWDDPPDGFRHDFRAYLADVDEDRYAPLTRGDDGEFVVAEESYAY